MNSGNARKGYLRMSPVSIGGREVGSGVPPTIVAEMSGNHNQSLERALALVDAAASAGAHALKIQTYTADTLTLDSDSEDFVVASAGNPWKGRRLYDLYREAHTPWDWHAAIIQRAKERGLVVFSTPFDETAVDFLEGLGIPAYKIASFELNHLPLIRKAAATGKPLILSTGMATVAEIHTAVETARDAGCESPVLLKCTSTYPALPADSNLATIPHMAELFQCQVGLSDHTLGLGAAVAGVAFGATLIEKHFTLDRADGGVDADFSLVCARWSTKPNAPGRRSAGCGTVPAPGRKARRPSGGRSISFAIVPPDRSWPARTCGSFVPATASNRRTSTGSWGCRLPGRRAAARRRPGRIFSQREKGAHDFAKHRAPRCRRPRWKHARPGQRADPRHTRL